MGKITLNNDEQHKIPAGAQIMLSGATTLDSTLFVSTAYEGLTQAGITGGLEANTIAGTNTGISDKATSATTTTDDLSIFIATSANGFKPILVTESVPAPRTSTSASAPTVAPATAPLACAPASRATPTTTATRRTCSPASG